MQYVSITNLCDFAARKGSIDTRYTPTPSSEDGRIAHALIQGQRKGNYIAEYPLQGSIGELKLRGRADGYRPISTNGYPELEEIKSHRGSLERLNPDKQNLHWAQLKVYGALLCLKDDLEQVQLTLCYIDIDSEKQHSISQYHTRQDLIKFSTELCSVYNVWHQQEMGHRAQRDQDLHAIKFCHPKFRAGQRQLAEDVYKTVATARVSLLEAPTGLGKTHGVLFPQLTAMPRHAIDRLFLLSHRNTGKSIWREALSELAPETLRVVQLEARHRSCDNPTLACHGESCPLAKGFYDRLPAARQQAADQAWLDNDSLSSIASQHSICRYFLAQEMAKWCDVVIADVNHYFDQQALLYGLMRQNNWRAALCLDEAHNSIDRARGMYSVSLDEVDLANYAKRAPAPLKPACNSALKAWREIRKSNPNDGTTFLHELPKSLVSSCTKLASKATEYMIENPGDAELQELMFHCMSFTKLAETFGNHTLVQWSVYKHRHRFQRARIKLQNIDPSDFLRHRWQDCQSAVLFSATLQPFEYYVDLLGIENPVTKAIPSLFTKDQLTLRVIKNIDTRLHNRQHTAQSIAQRIQQQLQETPGNYLIYTPSFAYQALLEHELCDLQMGHRIISQTESMSEDQRQLFINNFRQQRKILGLATLGGIFGEGIDLPGDELIGIFIVSLGLPPHDDFHREMQRQFSKRFGIENAYSYTFLIPAMRKVIQAAGRLLRNETDYGLIELIDQRFEQPEIKALLPTWWF